jgi:small ligand-binding sensory domain FIST
VRSAPFSDPKKGTVTLNGRVPQGAIVQIGSPDRKNLLHSCMDSVRTAMSAYHGNQPAAALFFSCAGRKIVMGSKIVQEVHTIRQHLPGIPFVGFYCYGEFGPLTRLDPICSMEQLCYAAFGAVKKAKWGKRFGKSATGRIGCRA